MPALELCLPCQGRERIICVMKAIQVHIDEATLNDIDRLLKGKRRARAEFIRQAVRDQLRRLHVRALEEQERRGYEKHPPTSEDSVFYRRRNWPPR